MPVIVFQIFLCSPSRHSKTITRVTCKTCFIYSDMGKFLQCILHHLFNSVCYTSLPTFELVVSLCCVMVTHKSAVFDSAFLEVKEIERLVQTCEQAVQESADRVFWHKCTML